MADLTEELMKKVLAEGVVAMHQAEGAYNRVLITTTSGIVLTADVFRAQTSTERLADIQEMLERFQSEKNTIEAAFKAVQPEEPISE